VSTTAAPTSSTFSSSASPSSAFAPLRHPVFRAVWIATVASNVGTWVQDVGNGWLMTSLSPSPLFVSLVQAATSLPVFLLALPAGALADVVDRRRLLLFTQAWMMLAALSLGMLTLAGLASPGLLLACAAMIGIGAALNGPAFQAVVPELVPRDELTAAVSLNGMALNLARAVGPAVGGLLVAAAGPGAAFMLNAASFLGVIAVLYVWRRQPTHSMLPAERIVGATRAGLRFALHARPLQNVLARTALFMLGASAYWALLPLLVRRQLKLGPTGYGLLLGCMGVGAFCGVFVLARARARVSSHTLVTAAALVFAAALAVVAVARRPVLVAPTLFVTGTAWVTALSSLSVAAQQTAPAWVRARVMACYLLVWFGSMAGGAVLWGAVAVRLGIGPTLGVAAVSMVVAAVAGTKIRLASGNAPDLSPALAWDDPAAAAPPAPDAGPVLVAIEYVVRPGSAEAFIAAMQPVRGERKRDGAFSWCLYSDAASPDRFTETFGVESWLEHLRQHERATVADLSELGQARAHLVDGTAPRVRHLLAAHPNVNAKAN
jgi:MFS family permease